MFDKISVYPLYMFNFCLENDFFPDAGLDQMKKIKVKQGETVTLKTGVTDIQRDDLLRWKYVESTVTDSTTSFSVIAVCDKRTSRVSVYDGPDGRFQDRLQLDHHTGNLTIKNTEVKDSGNFKVKIKSNTNPLIKTIKVNVRGEKLKDWKGFSLSYSNSHSDSCV